MPAVVERDVEPGLGAGVEKARAAGVLADDARERVRGNAVGRSSSTSSRSRSSCRGKGRKSSKLVHRGRTYAVPLSRGDTSIALIWIHSGMPFGVTSCQVLPPSRVTWTRPSSLPAQSTPGSTGDSAKAKIVS